MAGKKSPPKKNTEAPLTKADLKTEMVNYIGPIFEELKNDIRTVTGRMDGLDQKMNGFDQKMNGFDQKMNGFDQKLQSIPRQILHEMKILLERDDRLNAISDFGKTSEMNNEKIENLDGRVTHLEKDVQVLKVKAP